MADNKKKPKKTGFSLQGFDVQSYKQTEKYVQAIDVLYNQAVQEFATLAGNVSVNPDKPFSFSDYPATQAKAQQIISGLASKMQGVIIKGSRDQWLYACKKNDEFLNHILNTAKIPKKQLAKFQDRNLDALDAFQKRKTAGMDLSKRIWNYTGQMKTQMELGIDIAVGEGKSAAQLSRDLRQYLVDPDKLFRKVRDKHGNLVLSKNAAAFHPGQGKYRSSYKNAMRLTRSEINMAYRQSDQLRWQQLNFVVGYEIKLSNNHTTLVNGVPTPFKDICDELAGKYPKWFKWTAWHPQCYSEDTEVLTDNGWKLFKDLNTSDLIFSLNPETKQPEYVKYVNYIEYRKEGKMIRFSNKSLDMLVTEDHKMVYIKKADGNTIMTNKLADDFSENKGGFYRSSEYKADKCDFITIGKHVIPFDLYAEFMAYYLAEGSISWTRKNQFGIAQSKEKHSETYSKINNLLSKLPFKYTALKDRFYLCDADMCAYLKQFGKSAEKHVPFEIKTASSIQIAIFLDAYIICDGHSRKCKSFIGNRGTEFKSIKPERVFFSSSDQMASDIGELLVKIGSRPSYDLMKINGVEQKHKNGIYVGNKDLWRIRECYSKTATVFKKEYVDYSGFVYDIELEKNHILYVRRNGKCVWGSNCRCHVVPILRSREETNADELSELQAAFKGTEYKKFESKDLIRDVPDNFKQWVADKQEASKGWNSAPYWVKDNFNGGLLTQGLKVAPIAPKQVQKAIKTPEQKAAIQKAWNNRILRKKYASELNAIDNKWYEVPSIMDLKYKTGNEIINGTDPKVVDAMMAKLRHKIEVKNAWDAQKPAKKAMALLAKTTKMATNLVTKAEGFGFDGPELNAVKTALADGTITNASLNKLYGKLNSAYKQAVAASKDPFSKDALLKTYTKDEVDGLFAAYDKFYAAKITGQDIGTQMKKLQFEVDWLEKNGKYATSGVLKKMLERDVVNLKKKFEFEMFKKDADDLILANIAMKDKVVVDKIKALEKVLKNKDLDVNELKTAIGNAKAAIDDYHTNNISTISADDFKFFENENDTFSITKHYTEPEKVKVKELRKKLEDAIKQSKGNIRTSNVRQAQLELTEYMYDIQFNHLTKQQPIKHIGMKLNSNDEFEFDYITDTEAKAAFERYISAQGKGGGFYSSNVGGEYWSSSCKEYTKRVKKAGGNITAEATLPNRYFSGSGFINGYIGKKDLSYIKGNQSLQETLHDYVAGLSYAVNKLPRHNGITYRGVSYSSELIARLTACKKAGKPFVHEYGMSTSITPNVADNFGTGITFKIYGKSGIYAREFSAYSSELEVLYRPGSRFEVMEVYQETTNNGIANQGKWTVILKEILK